MSYAKIVGTMVILIGVVLGVAACGKGSDENDKLSRSALPAEANPICAKAEAELTAVRQPIGITNPVQAATYFRTVQRIKKKATGELGNLKPDTDVEADYEAYLAAENAELELVDKIVKKAEARDRSGFEDIKQLGPLARKSDVAAKKAGLNSCVD